MHWPLSSTFFKGCAGKRPDIDPVEESDDIGDGSTPIRTGVRGFSMGDTSASESPSKSITKPTPMNRNTERSRKRITDTGRWNRNKQSMRFGSDQVPFVGGSSPYPESGAGGHSSLEVQNRSTIGEDERETQTLGESSNVRGEQRNGSHSLSFDSESV